MGYCGQKFVVDCDIGVLISLMLDIKGDKKMNDKEITDKEMKKYKMRCIRRIKAFFRFLIRTNTPFRWEGIEAMARKYNIDMDVVKTLYAKAKVECGL